MTGRTIHDRTPDGLLEIVDVGPDAGGALRVTIRETMGGGCLVGGFPVRRARTLALSALPGATSARVLRRFVGGTCEHVTFTVSAPAPHAATATREGVQGWRPGCSCGWAHPWHFPTRAAALVAAQSVAAAHRIESGAES